MFRSPQLCTLILEFFLQKGKVISRVNRVVTIAIDADVYREAEPKEGDAPVEPVTAPTSTPQEATPKHASEATDTQKEPTLKQGRDVTKTDEGGQLVGVSARKKIHKNPCPQVHVFLIYFLLFLKHFSKCRSKTLHSKLVHSFYRRKAEESSLEDDKKARDKEAPKQIKPTLFYKGSKLTSRTGDRLATLSVTGSGPEMVNMSTTEKEKHKQHPSTLKQCRKGGKQD